MKEIKTIEDFNNLQDGTVLMVKTVLLGFPECIYVKDGSDIILVETKSEIFRLFGTIGESLKFRTHIMESIEIAPKWMQDAWGIVK